MMRLIDADALWDKVLEHTKDGDVIHRIPPDFIDNAPTVDAEPVRHGRWIECDWVEPDGHGFGTIRFRNAALKCSECNNAFKKDLLWKRNYCNNCGAKMDEGGKEHGQID